MRTLKIKTLAAWLAIPFGAAIASDCGAPFQMLAWVMVAWIIASLAILRIWHVKEENERQRRLSACRRYSRDE